MVVFLLFVFVIAMGVAVVAGIISGIKQSSAQTDNRMRRTSPHTQGYTNQQKFNHPTKANSNPIPINPRYYNIGSTIFHKSKECNGFSLLNTWDAITESEALSKGLIACPKCKETIVFVYPRGRVYHRTKFCSDSQSIPAQVSETEAISRGLHRCGKCW